MDVVLTVIGVIILVMIVWWLLKFFAPKVNINSADICPELNYTIIPRDKQDTELKLIKGEYMHITKEIPGPEESIQILVNRFSIALLIMGQPIFCIISSFLQVGI